MKEKDFLQSLNLQLFAEDGDELPKDPEGGDKTKEPEKTFKQEDVNVAVQDAVTRAKENWEKEYQEKLKEEKAEAERLSKLNEEERKAEELKLREEKIAAKEKDYATKDLKNKAADILEEKGLDRNFADIVLGADAETTKANIDTFKKSFDEAVEKAVIKRLGGKAPEIGNETAKTNSDSMTDEEFYKNYEKNRK